MSTVVAYAGEGAVYEPSDEPVTAQSQLWPITVAVLAVQRN